MRPLPIVVLLAPLAAGCDLELTAVLTADTADESICPPASDASGGYRDVSTSDAHVLEAAAFAVEAISGSPDTPYEILCAQEQVVAGTNYRLGLDIDDVDHLVVVYEDLQGDYELTSSAVVP